MLEIADIMGSLCTHIHHAASFAVDIFNAFAEQSLPKPMMIDVGVIYVIWPHSFNNRRE